MAKTLTALERELTHDHWKHVYNWNGIEPYVIASRHECSKEDVVRMMRKIEAKHPNPNPTHAEKIASKANGSSTCKYCMQPIVWISNKACEPSVEKFVAANGQIYTGRILHNTKCSHVTG